MSTPIMIKYYTHNNKYSTCVYYDQDWDGRKVRRFMCEAKDHETAVMIADALNKCQADSVYFMDKEEFVKGMLNDTVDIKI